MKRLALVLAFAAVASATAGTLPLHEMEALHGHEHCCGPGIGHVCHDHDACVTCSLLALPHACGDVATPPPAAENPPRDASATPDDDPFSTDFPTVSARGPPRA